MMIQKNFYDSWWFFSFMMILLFIVSYLFWGVLFLGPNKREKSLERGLHNNVSINQKAQSQRGMFQGMGGGTRRTDGVGTANGGGTRSSQVGGGGSATRPSIDR